ncbi:MAG TPA: DUF1566 domain-containing protein [Polyangiaceae bacterium]|nr:DUF1566 domain-containing protein [Polyangiaceae bacterium]
MRAASTIGCAALALPCTFASCAASPERVASDGGTDSGSTATEGRADAGDNTSSASTADATSRASDSGGACATPCTSDLTCCSGACVDFRNDPAHCGSCSTLCDASAMEVCAAGRCGAVDWALWPMPNGTDDVSNGAPNPNTYSDNLDGTVSDQVTHLMWQQRVPATGGAGDDGNLTWAEAKAYCATLAAAGHDDWRLPTQIELVSLVDYSNLGAGQPPIDSAVFPDTPAAAFWSSTTHASAETEAWTVYMDVGFTYAYDMSALGRVRCVR